MTLRYALLDHDDRGQLKEFHNLVFRNTNASDEWFSWYLDTIGRRVTRVYGIWDAGRLIGTWCVEPKLLNTVPGQVAQVGRCFAVGIHPECRRRNLFVELSTFAIEQERNVHMDYDYVLGFPQVGRPVIDAHLKSGWKRVQEIEMLAWRPDASCRPALGNVKLLGDFIHLPAAREYAGSFKEDAAYRNLRWLRHPDTCYTVLSSNESSWLVLKTYGGNCHVLDLAGEPHAARELLEAAKTLAYRHRWQELTIWCAANDPHRDDVEACGFAPGATCNSSVVMLAVEINARGPLTLPKTHFQMGSEEIY